MIASHQGLSTTGNKIISSHAHQGGRVQRLTPVSLNPALSSIHQIIIPNPVKPSSRTLTHHQTCAYWASRILSSPWDCWNRCRLSLCPRKRSASARSWPAWKAKACGPANMLARFAVSASIPMQRIPPNFLSTFRSIKRHITLQQASMVAPIKRLSEYWVHGFCRKM